ncbi:MAG TPA: tyrosine-type recombinase/integrase [Tepidisphaeraceae bacterium]|nr:tyrosine-type recombinase/integrase [Tepidisphaeraceae bacterium]
MIELRKVMPVDVSAVGTVLVGGVVEMDEFKRDLSAAGIAEVDERGRRVDFHALRHTLATNLNRAGVAPRVAQEIMRHSELSLTMRTYTDAGALPTMDGVNALPRWGWSSSCEAAIATGTDGREVVLQSGSEKAVQQGPRVSITGKSARTVKPGDRSVKSVQSPRLSSGVRDAEVMRPVGLEPTTR